MEKGLTVPKWVLIVQPKISQVPRIYLPNLSAQPQRLHWASVVRDQDCDISTATIHWVSSLVNKERPNNRVQRWLLSSE